MSDTEKAIEEIKYILDIINELQDLVNYIRKNNLTTEQFFTMYNNDDIYLFYKLVSVLRINRYDFCYMEYFYNDNRDEDLKKCFNNIINIYNNYNYKNHPKTCVHDDLKNDSNTFHCVMEYKILLNIYEYLKTL